MTLDEVGEEEEEKISPRTRGRPRKRTRQTPGNPTHPPPPPTTRLFFKSCSLFHDELPSRAVTVRRSVRGKSVTSKDEEVKAQPATSPEKDESSLSPDSQREPPKTEAKAASAEPQPGNRTLEGERSRTDIKGKKNNPRMLG